jgi:hypothetical protein
MSEQVQDSALFDQEVDVQPEVNQDDAVLAAQLATARAEAKAEAYKEVAMGRKQDSATQPFTIPTPIPNDPTDLLNTNQKQELENMYLTDPAKAARWYGQLSSQVERMRIERDSAPLIRSQASTIVDLYVARKSRDNALAAKIEPLFRQKLANVDIRPLVGMEDNQREAELGLRWDAAEGEIRRNEPVRQEPSLVAAGRGAGGGTRLKKNDDFGDPVVASLAKQYGFTVEQYEAYIASQGPVSTDTE